MLLSFNRNSGVYFTFTITDDFAHFVKQPVLIVSLKRAGVDWCSGGVKRDPPPWHSTLLIWASPGLNLSMTQDRKQWRKRRAHLQKVTLLIKVTWFCIRHTAKMIVSNTHTVPGQRNATTVNLTPFKSYAHFLLEYTVWKIKKETNKNIISLNSI